MIRNGKLIWLESRKTVKYRRLYMCCPYSVYSRLCLVLSNKWPSSRLGTGLNSAAGKREGGKEADTTRVTLVGLLESRSGVCGWEEREPACFSSPPPEAQRQEWHMHEPVGMTEELWWRKAIVAHESCANRKRKPPGLAGFSKVTASEFRAF